MWSLYQWVAGGKYSLCVTIAIAVLSLLISTPESSLETFHLPPPSIGSLRAQIAFVILISDSQMQCGAIN